MKRTSATIKISAIKRDSENEKKMFNLKIILSHKTPGLSLP
jgi:hypothetical protein